MTLRKLFWTASFFAVIVISALLYNTEWLELQLDKYVRTNANNVSLSSHGDDKLEYNYCCCSERTVDENTPELLTILNRITAKSYFRYFRVDTEKPCPFWAVTLLCTSAENACEVCKCDANEIPEALREENDMSDVIFEKDRFGENTYSPPHLDQWGVFEVHDEKAKYVDLLQNPESNTGYSGPMASKVWEAIYNENCIKLEKRKHCQQVHVLRTLLSGLQFSISMHLCTNFKKDLEHKSPQYTAGIYNNPNTSFYPNCEMYQKRIAPNPQYADNLYVLYEFLLRALTKAKSQFIDDLESFNTGKDGAITNEDRQLHDDLRELYNSKLLCVKTFDETRFFETPAGREIVPEMGEVLHNVTNIMNCVTCEKCRIWGKIMTKGIYTALRIIAHNDTTPLKLDRSEKVTLINILRQITFSVRNNKRLLTECAKKTYEVEQIRNEFQVRK